MVTGATTADAVDRAHRRPQGRARADPPPPRRRRAAARAARDRRGEQDRPARLLGRMPSPPSPRRCAPSTAELGIDGRARAPGVGARGRQHRRPLGAHPLVRRPGAARAARVAPGGRTSSSRSSSRSGFRCSSCCARRAGSRPSSQPTRPRPSGCATTARSPAASRRGVVRVGDRVEIFPAGIATTVTGIQVAGAEVDEATAPQSVVAASSPTTSTPRAARSSSPPARCRRHAASSRPSSSSSTRGR